MNLRDSFELTQHDKEATHQRGNTLDSHSYDCSLNYTVENFINNSSSALNAMVMEWSVYFYPKHKFVDIVYNQSDFNFKWSELLHNLSPGKLQRYPESVLQRTAA